MTELDVQTLLQFVFEADESESTINPDCQHLLHAYIEVELAGENGAEQYPQVHNCIETDPTFRQSYEELKELLHLEQQGTFVEPPIPGNFDRDFLESGAPQEHKRYQLQWYLNELGHLIVHLTGQLIDSAKESVEQVQASLANQPRPVLAGELRSTLSQLPQFSLKGVVDDMEVQIQAKEIKDDATACQIKVQVNIPSRGGWPNLGKISVALRQGEQDLGTRLTNAFGIVTFPPVELKALDYLVFEIVPPT